MEVSLYSTGGVVKVPLLSETEFDIGKDCGVLWVANLARVEGCNCFGDFSVVHALEGSLYVVGVCVVGGVVALKVLLFGLFILREVEVDEEVQFAIVVQLETGLVRVMGGFVAEEQHV